MLSPIDNALVFLVDIIFNTYILLIMLRFLLQWLRVGLRGDPILQLLWRLTDPPLRFLYRFIPGWRHIDFAAIFLMFVLEIVKIMLLHLILGKWMYVQQLGMMGLLLSSLANLLSLLIYIFVFTITIQVILSWVTPPGSYNPLSSTLYYLNQPVLRPVQRRLPPLQGIDFSPMIVVLGLILIDKLLIGYLRLLVY